MPGSELLIAAALLAVAGGLLLALRGDIGSDLWLALVGGRQVANHSVPHHALTVYAAGRKWIDQQWLAQLIIYRLDRLGGLVLVGIADVAMLMIASVAGVVAAARLGAPASRIVNVLPFALACALLGGVVRAQPYCYVLFVVTTYLLARHAATGSYRTLWCLPVLVLWANLHGSAALGAALVVLRGLVVMWERREQLGRSPAAWVLPGLLVLAPGPLLLITPYGTGTVDYYTATLLDGHLRSVVVEWMPVTADPVVAVSCLLLAALAAWSLWTSRAQAVWWERLVLVVLFAGAVIAVRNVVWFGLGALVLVPKLLGPSAARARTASSRPLLNSLILAAGCLCLIAGVVVTASRSEAALVPAYPNAGLAVVSAQLQREPALQVFADERYADWLMWHIPRLVGRVAYNASLELLTGRQLDAIVRFKGQVGRNWQRAADGYRLLVLDSGRYPALGRFYRTAPGTRTLFDRDGLQIVSVSSS